jgi:hypothetical protein
MVNDPPQPSRSSQAEKECESQVYGIEFGRQHLSEDAPDAAFVDRSKMIDECK